jgi:Zn-dependent protease with chaperone function
VSPAGDSPLPIWVGLVNAGLRLLVVAVLSLALTWALHALVLRRARRFDGAHWAARARALWPLRNMMSFAAVAVTVVSALLVTSRPSTREVLSAPQLGLFAGVLAGSLAWSPRLELDVKLGALSRPRGHLREALGVSLLFFPLVWLLAAVLLANLGGEPYGIALGTVASAVGLLLTGLGAGSFLARELGLLTTASERLRAAVTRAAANLGRTAPRAFELEWGRANAAALPTLGWVVVTRRALEVLDDERLEAIVAHEIAHLTESPRVKAFRVVGQLAALPLLIGILYAQAGSFEGLLYGTLLTVLGLFAHGVVNRRLERRADANAHQASESSYAAALEALYRANLTPAVLRSHSHPSLYDRLLAAGRTPDYERPAPPRAWLRYLAVPIVPLFYLGYVAATDVVAGAAPDPETADTVGLHLGTALGNEESESVLTARWVQAGRIDEALAQLRATARPKSGDVRFHRIFVLEMERGNCPGALEALRAVSEGEPSLGLDFEAAYRERCGAPPLGPKP